MLKFSKKLFLYNFFTQVKKKKKRKKKKNPLIPKVRIKDKPQKLDIKSFQYLF